MSYTWEVVGPARRHAPAAGEADTVEEAAQGVAAALCLGKHCDYTYADHGAAARAALESLAPGETGMVINAHVFREDYYGNWWDGPRPGAVLRRIRITRTQTPAPAPLAEGGRR